MKHTFISLSIRRMYPWIGTCILSTVRQDLRSNRSSTEEK